MAGLLDYSAGSTVLHRLNPIAKIALALAVCIAAFLSDSFVYLLVLLAFNVCIGLVGGIRKKTFSLLFGLVKICIFLFVLQVLFIRAGTPVFLFVTDEGLRIATLVVLHLPYKYAFTVTTALKFIPVFTDEMSSIIESQTARGVDFDTKNPIRKLRLVLPLCAPLLITSVGRTEQAAMAAEVRGFYLRDRSSGSKEYPFGMIDGGALAVIVVLVVLAVLV